jgi:hypothetical protein
VTGPTVAITSPVSGTPVAGLVALLAEASDDNGVVGVQFELDGALLGAEDTLPPYELLWNAANSPNGQHTLTAVARDTAGNQATAASIVVTVMNDTTAPTVVLTGPAAGTVSGTATVAATATDDVGVAGVQFLLDGVSLGAEDIIAPYEVSWATLSAANGEHTLTAVARDTAGNQATAASVLITVMNDTTAPTVLLTGPAGGTVSGIVTIAATATDDVAVAGVQFLVDGVSRGAEDVSAPYELQWAARTAPEGVRDTPAG